MQAAMFANGDYSGAPRCRDSIRWVLLLGPPSMNHKRRRFLISDLHAAETWPADSLA